MPRDLDDVFAVWDRGEFLFSDLEQALLDLPDGSKLGDILSKSTKCPIHNGTCESMIIIKVYGMNPDKGYKLIEVQVCPLGVEGDGDACPLNK